MSLLGPLAGLLGIETGALVQRLKENAVALAAIGLFGLIGVTFLLVAAYTALTWWVGPIWAPLILAIAAFVIAIVLYVALQVQQKAVARREAERKHEVETVAVVASTALSILPALLESPIVRTIGVPVALYAAFLLFTGASSKSAASAAAAGTAQPRKRRTSAA